MCINEDKSRVQLKTSREGKCSLYTAFIMLVTGCHVKIDLVDQLGYPHYVTHRDFTPLPRGIIMQTYPCNGYPLYHTFIKQIGDVQRCTYLFLFVLRNIDCGHSLEPPHRDGSDVYTHSIF